MNLNILSVRLLFSYLICLLFLFTACKKHDEIIQPDVVTVDPPVLSVAKSTFFSYWVRVRLNNVAVDTSGIKFTSADIHIATVNGQGLVHTVAAGETTVTATLLNGKGSAVCKVIISDSNAYKFRITLKDKGTSGFSVGNPSQFLSAKAITRRQKMHIPVDATDLPISADYINAIQKVGGVVVAKSKWLNTVSVYCENELLSYEFKKLPFVQDVEEVWQGKKVTQIPQQTTSGARQKHNPSSPAAARDAAYYGNSWVNISTNNGQVLHQKGYEGQGIDIADIDSGFGGLNTNPFFDNTNIMGAKSFVYENADPYSIEAHGVWVTSCMAVDHPGTYVGTAPAANYWLLHTEDDATEFPIEEDYWTAAAEYADSVGVDMINTSLTYSYHDGPNDHYTYETMDGKTAFVTRAANMAVNKGIFITCCAGNEQTWVGAPADAPDVLTVGSLNRSGVPDYFTDYGVTVDGRMKPDVMALGGGAGVIDISGLPDIRSGTSYASPNMCGMIACLWQAYPKLTNKELLKVVRQAGDRYSSPVVPYGYGTPDMQKAMQLAKAISDTK